MSDQEAVPSISQSNRPNVVAFWLFMMFIGGCLWFIVSLMMAADTLVKTYFGVQ